jgi:hypothetical protein
VRHVEAPGGKCRTQNRVQPTASDSSDSLFFIRKLRCEGTHFGVKLSEALLRGVRRYAPCTSAQDRAACGKINGFEPTFWGDFGLFWPSKKGACFHALNTGRCPRLHLCCGVSPLNPAKIPLRGPRRGCSAPRGLSLFGGASSEVRHCNCSVVD